MTILLQWVIIKSAIKVKVISSKLYLNDLLLLKLPICHKAEIFLEGLMDYIIALKDFLWNYVIIFLLVFVGIFFTIKLKFPQIRRIGQSIKLTVGGVFKKKEGPKEEGEVSSFQALSTAVAAQLGTGSVGGVASAIMVGGPGAVFWMWISGMLGMSTIFAEAILAQVYRQEKDGDIYGGPAYYIRDGLKNKKLAKFLSVTFAIFIVLALGFAGNMVQSNSIAISMKEGFGIKPAYIGIVLAVLVAMIVMGGIQRISKIAELIVPIMASIFFLAGIVILVMFRQNIIPVIKTIFVSAFTGSAVFGAAAGISVQTAIKMGLSRGLFANEAGMGSTPHAHAVANVEKPADQGLSAMFGVLVGIIICTVTAFSILLTDAHLESYKLGLDSVAVTQLAFETAFGRAGSIFLAISLFFFAFSTIVGWYYFGESNIVYLFGNKAVLVYRLLVIIAVMVGTVVSVDTVWMLSDTFNALMVIPNVIGLLLLSKIVVKEADRLNDPLKR